MKVYVVKACFDYEGYEIVGIYDTKEKAKAAKEYSLRREVCGDEVTIDEYIINNITSEVSFMLDESDDAS